MEPLNYEEAIQLNRIKAPKNTQKRHYDSLASQSEIKKKEVFKHSDNK